MQNVILLIHLLLTMSLIIVVLLQRSEGGGLGMGGASNITAGRSAATAMAKLTWIFGIGLFTTSLALTIIAARNSSGSSVLDRITDRPPAAEAPAEPATSSSPLGSDSLLPPAEGDNAPLIPKAD